MLPASTSPFDILLHKRTPLDQQIPHLAVQCGNKNVHALSEALATILTGESSALYIPRFAFSQMTDTEAHALFQTHDAYVKSLRWLPLFPLLSNLDRPRKEYQPDGSFIERTTREWARSIKDLDGKSSAQCDVVNGGLDQLPYLLFTPSYTEAATVALEDYRRRLYPFTQREAQFRDTVGPPPYIHFSKSVIANLDFIKRLSSSNNSSISPTSKESEAEQSSVTTPDSGITDSSVSQITRPPTPAESLRRQYSQRRHTSSDSSDQSDDTSTAVSTATSPSKLSDGRMSTNSAKFRELDAAIQRQKKTNDKNDAKTSERISHIERQLHRIDDIDTKLDDVKNDFGQRLNLFEARMVDTVKDHIEASNHNTANMTASMEKLMIIVNRLLTQQNDNIADNSSTISRTSTHTGSLEETGIVAAVHATDTAPKAGQTSSSTSSSSRSSMSSESMNAIQSPEHKRLKSGQKPPKESVRRHLALAMEAASRPPSSPKIATQESFDSLDLAMQQLEEITHAGASSNTAVPVLHNNISDPESQYKASPPTQDEKDTSATPSPGRTSKT